MEKLLDLRSVQRRQPLWDHRWRNNWKLEEHWLEALAEPLLFHLRLLVSGSWSWPPWASQEWGSLMPFYGSHELHQVKVAVVDEGFKLDTLPLRVWKHTRNFSVLRGWSLNSFWVKGWNFVLCHLFYVFYFLYFLFFNLYFFFHVIFYSH